MKSFWAAILLLCFHCTHSQELDSTARLLADSNAAPLPGTSDPKKSIELNGQVNIWQTTRFSNPVNWQAGGRFLSSLVGNFPLRGKSKIDMEASIIINGSLNYEGLSNIGKAGSIDPYRIWLRYAGENWEIRGGLQKINFGPAKMLRPLMWFDGMDVRDPLKLTTGVYGVLGRYFFKNNANIWLWSLLCNKKPVGWQTVGSAPWRPEFGGRVELPALAGELGLSTHFRKADLRSMFPALPQHTLLSESRIGLDGRWDAGVGLWFESSITHTQKNDHSIASYQDLWNVGGDYTFAIGNGLGLTVEYFRYHYSNRLLQGGKSMNVAGAMCTYPLNVLDNLSAMSFYETGQRLWFNYISWTRTYDKWMFYVMGFWNPSVEIPMSTALQGKNLFTGKGLQLMATYNF